LNILSQCNSRYILFYKSLTWLANRNIWPNNSHNIFSTKYLNVVSKNIYCDERLKEKGNIMSTLHDQNVTLSFRVGSVQILSTNILEKKKHFLRKNFFLFFFWWFQNRSEVNNALWLCKPLPKFLFFLAECDNCSYQIYYAEPSSKTFVAHIYPIMYYILIYDFVKELKRLSSNQNWSLFIICEAVISIRLL